MVADEPSAIASSQRPKRNIIAGSANGPPAWLITPAVVQAPGALASCRRRRRTRYELPQAPRLGLFYPDAMDPRVAQGVGEFNAGRFFEAHEFWEDLWLETVGHERLLLQGLIQIAAGYLKAESGNRGATIKLLTKGLNLVRQFLPRALGLELQPFVQAVAGDLALVQQMEPDGFTSTALCMPRLESSPA